MLHNSRRLFLQKSFLSSAVLVMYSGEVFSAVTPIKTINLVQRDLFPFAEALHVETSSYINIILNHSRVTTEDKMFIRNGVQWLNEEAVKMYQKTYVALDSKKRQSVLRVIAKERWGESWIERMLSYIMEAVFSDKVYGVNPQESGQKWLGFSKGLPSPKRALL